MLGWIAAAVAAGLAVVVGNTLRMLMLARQDEITLMRLFGAAEWFVRMPYLVEGTMLGAGAGAVAWVLMLISLHAFGAGSPQPLGMLAAFVGGGVVIGAVGAWIATLGVGEEA
ncbi:MAG: hypothetical protein D6771_04975 [Zetaproteobacteria bacterium]|nr:MAG: hypothetical protein D6771_04975 [Zetaproteobacteria bacterium]